MSGVYTQVVNAYTGTPELGPCGTIQMAADYSISYTHQSKAGEEELDRLLAFTGCDRIDLEGSGALLINRNSGAQTTVSPEVATALRYCGTFRTLQEHARTLVETIPQLRGQLGDVTRVLESVRDAGIFLEAESVIQRLRKTPETVSTPAATRVCIITCDRPTGLERLLESMLSISGLNQHDQLLVIDDSRDTENAEQNRERVTRFNLSSSKRMCYLGPKEQRLFLQRLIAESPQHEQEIRFLIDRDRWTAHSTYGLARTMALLGTVGYRGIVLDDDTLCASVNAPFPGSGISFGGNNNRQLACFGSEQELMQRATFADTDPLTGHSLCLGQSLGEALSTLGFGESEASSLRGESGAMLDTLHADSPVLLTQCGSWGDPGTGGGDWLTFLDDDSLSRVLSAPDGLAGALSRPHYWLGRTRPNVTKMGVMSQATGLDNSRLLPPYFPAGRSEDYLFASMLLFIHPRSAAIDYDWCVPHLPLEPRGITGDISPRAYEAGLGLLARHLTDNLAYDAGSDPETRLQLLVIKMQELSEAHPSTLMADYRRELAGARAEQLQRLRRVRQRTSKLASTEWEAFLQGGLRRVSTSLQSSPSLSDIPDAPSGRSEEQLLALGQDMLGQFSRAISAWPRLRQASSALFDAMLASGELDPN